MIGGEREQAGCCTRKEEGKQNDTQWRELFRMICIEEWQAGRCATRMASRDVHRSNQTRESTVDWPAFLHFGSSSGYNNCNPNWFRFEFELQFLLVDRIPDHQSNIIDRVNVNIGWVQYYEYFILSESDGAILLIRSHMILYNGMNRVAINIPVTLSTTTVINPWTKHWFVRYNIESSVKLVKSGLTIIKLDPGPVGSDWR